jgi:NADH dehydrogenase
LKALGAEVVQGDLRDPQSLRGACEGVRAVLAAAHAFEGKGNDGPRAIDDRGNRNLIDAAKSAGVKHVVFTSILGVSSDHPVDFFRIKHSIEGYLKESGLSYTILRPAAFMEFWAALVGVPVLTKGETTIFGRGQNPVNFVSVDDVARFALFALQDPAARNTTIEIGGPQNLTLLQVAETFERVSGRTARKKHIPLPVMRVMRVVTRPLNEALSRQIASGIYMDTGAVSFDPAPTLQRFPTFATTLTPLADVARKLHSVQPLGAALPASG